jgi:hypothetical protein
MEMGHMTNPRVEKVTETTGNEKPESAQTEQLTPEEYLAELRAALPSLSKTETARMLEHGRAWATVFYHGSIPAEVNSEFDELEAKWLS